MIESEIPIVSCVVAVYPDHGTAERAVRELHEAGFAYGDLSIVGRNFQVIEEPTGFVSNGSHARDGACFGALFGWCLGAAFLILPGLGHVVVVGSLTTVVLAVLEGALAGTALGSLAGALVGWGVPKDLALEYEMRVKGGEFLVVVRSNPEVVARARSLLPWSRGISRSLRRRRLES